MSDRFFCPECVAVIDANACAAHPGTDVLNLRYEAGRAMLADLETERQAGHVLRSGVRWAAIGAVIGGILGAVPLVVWGWSGVVPLVVAGLGAAVAFPNGRNAGRRNHAPRYDAWVGDITSAPDAEMYEQVAAMKASAGNGLEPEVRLTPNLGPVGDVIEAVGDVLDR